jgi:heavy metal sensor kinase
MMLPRRRDLGRLSRSLRVRLAASYTLFFAILLVGMASLYRVILSNTLERQSSDVLDQQWAAMKGYLRIERNPETNHYEAYWYYDQLDPDENRIVSNIQQVYVITDAEGKVIPRGDAEDRALSISPAYNDTGPDKGKEIQSRIRLALQSERPGGSGRVFWTVRRNSHGVEYMVRSGVVWDEGHHNPYYVAVGAPLTRNHNIISEFTLIYAAVIPLAILLSSVLGWFMAGRALTPVLAVAQAAQRISGSNLSLRIPTREAGDELDYLILTFNRMIERLEASFQQIKRFSTDVSHELRTPITAIRGQLEVALFTATNQEQYREAIINALQDIDRLSQIVRALLLLSQAESGQLALQKSPLELKEVVEDLADQLQIPAEAAGVTLEASAPDSCTIEADRVQIERMITNLLSNAIKFTPPGGEVRISAQAEGDVVRLVVADTGRGIAAEFLPHIFERFYRVPGSGAAPGADQGMGLGLSFVAWIAQAHGGSVDVESTPGKGTQFTVTLPRQVQGTAPAEFRPGTPPTI